MRTFFHDVTPKYQERIEILGSESETQKQRVTETQGICSMQYLT